MHIPLGRHSFLPHYKLSNIDFGHLWYG